MEEKTGLQEVERAPYPSESMRVRCPQCRKLYLVQLNDVKEAKPRFECVQCHARFCVSLSEADLHAEITGIPLQMRSASPASDGGLPRSKDLAAAWKRVIANYTDEALHSDFLRLAHRERNLPYAAAQYGQMLKLMPSDEIALKRIAEVQALGSLVLMPNEQLGNDKQWTEEKRQRPALSTPRRYLRLWQVPVLMALIMMILGLLLPVLRNMVGVGAAFFFLALVAQIHFGRR